MRNKTYFADLLSYSYAQVKANDKSIVSRLNYLSEYIFKFTTYNSEMGEFFAAVALEVAAAITNGVTHYFIDDSAIHHKWYLVMVNMPFFSGRLDWGCSVRNAWWWDQSDYLLETLGLYEDGEQLGPLELTQNEWVEFVRGMLIFAKDELEQLNVLAQLDC
jgi:hypothetical protein